MPANHKRRLPESCSNGIDGLEHCRASDDSALQLALSGEVQHRDADQNGEYALTWKNQHRDSSNDEHGPDQIFENIKADSNNRMTGSKSIARPVLIEIVHRQPDQQHGYCDQRSDKENDGQDTENNKILARNQIRHISAKYDTEKSDASRLICGAWPFAIVRLPEHYRYDQQTSS